MARRALRSPASLLSTVLLCAAPLFVGCGDDGTGGGTGGKAKDAAAGAGGKGTGGAGGAGGSTAPRDAGRDLVPDTGAGSGGAGGLGGATGVDAGAGGVGGAGGAPVDGSVDAPIGTGGTGGSDAGPPVDVAITVDTGGKDGGTVDVMPSAPMHVYVGCADSTGTLLIYTLNPGTATLAPVSTFLLGGAISNAEWNEVEDRLYVAHMGGSEAKLSTLSRNATTGALSAVGTAVAVPFTPPSSGVDGGVDGGVATVDGGTATGNAGPQTLTFDRKRGFVAVPNYFSGYTYVYAMASNGTIGNLVSWHTAGANAHHAVFTTNNDFMLVPYLGANLIQVYAFNENTGAIVPSGSTAMPAAKSGPRHVALHGNGKWLYAINETAGEPTTTTGTIDFFTVNQTAGTVTATTTFQVPLPTGYTGAKNGSEIEISPAGDLLFVSMRLDNTAIGNLVSYRIDQSSGALALIEQESSRGVTPRQFTLSKDGKLLLVGNQNSDTVAVFRVDPATGDMTYVSERDVCDSPRFVKLAAVQ